MQRGDPWNWSLKILKSKNEIYQRIELKEWMKKIGVICLVIMLTPGVVANKMSKMAHFLHFLLLTAKSQSQFGQNIQMRLKDFS